jgi:hypothetical protein
MSGQFYETPERTAAVIVGIETYQDENFPRLDGVADDARKFAEWLVDHGVPADRVLLFLSDGSHTPQPRHVFNCDGKPVEIHVRPANLDDIRKAFPDEILEWRRLGEIGLLIVFWAGHGFLEKNDKRMLDFANVRSWARQPLNFTSLMEHMKAPPYPFLQVAFVDACAVYAKSQGKPSWEYGELSFPVNSKCDNFKQFMLYLLSAHHDRIFPEYPVA